MYELDFIRWLSGAFDADYCTNADVDADPGLLDRYRLFIGVGHDEYASTKARQGIASFLDRGGNALSLSGNTCWWRVDLEDGNRTIKCDKPAYQSKPTEIIPLLGAFFENPPHALGTLISEVPRKKLAGDLRQSLGYSVCQANHWSFAGTGLKDGEVFGEEECVVGYEADAADFNLGDYGKENLGLSWPTVLARIDSYIPETHRGLARICTQLRDLPPQGRQRLGRQYRDNRMERGASRGPRLEMSTDQPQSCERDALSARRKGSQRPRPSAPCDA